MQYAISFMVLVVLASTTVVPHVGPIESHIPLIYKVSLNDPPEVRWAPIARDFAEPLARFMEFIDRIPIPNHQQGVMFERLDRDQEFNFSSAVPVPEDLAREFGLLDG